MGLFTAAAALVPAVGIIQRISSSYNEGRGSKSGEGKKEESKREKRGINE